MRALRVVAVTLLGSACYAYVPLHTMEPRPGTRISADLTDSGSATLGEYLGRDATTVQGRVMGVVDTALEVSVVSVRSRNGQESFWKGEPVSLRRSLIAQLRERRLAKGGTLLVGGAIIAGLVLAVDAVSGGIFGSDKGGPPPPGQ
jgi:hypothetical protein